MFFLPSLSPAPLSLCVVWYGQPSLCTYQDMPGYLSREDTWENTCNVFVVNETVGNWWPPCHHQQCYPENKNNINNKEEITQCQHDSVTLRLQCRKKYISIQRSKVGQAELHRRRQMQTGRKWREGILVSSRLNLPITTTPGTTTGSVSGELVPKKYGFRKRKHCCRHSVHVA